MDLVVVVTPGDHERATLRRVVTSPLGRLAPRFTVDIVDETSGRVIVRHRVDGSEHEARALASLIRDELGELGAEDFLRRSRWATRRR